MRRQYPKLQWLCADCAEHGALGPADAYAAALDKGALDSMLEARSQEGLAQGRKFVAEIHRVLRPGGKYTMFSNGSGGECSRLDVLKEHFDEGSIECNMMEGMSTDLWQKFMWVFVCYKGGIPGGGGQGRGPNGPREVPDS